MKELELMKAETGMPGSIKFGGSSFKALDAEVSASMSANSSPSHTHPPPTEFLGSEYVPREFRGSASQLPDAPPGAESTAATGKKKKKKKKKKRRSQSTGATGSHSAPTTPGGVADTAPL